MHTFCLLCTSYSASTQLTVRAGKRSTIYAAGLRGAHAKGVPLYDLDQDPASERTPAPKGVYPCVEWGNGVFGSVLINEDLIQLAAALTYSVDEVQN
jgi:hypothetical protein